MNDLISVIVPVYNVENYLENCIKSVLNQKYSFFELLLINDGSTDNSLSICLEYKKKDSRIVLINQENQGLSGARNAGLDAIKGKYVTFIDSDDFIDNDYLYILYNTIKQSNVDMVWTPFLSFYEVEDIKDKLLKTNEVSITFSEEIFKYMFNEAPEYLIVSWGKLYRREIFDFLRFKIGKTHEDEFIIHHILIQCKKIAFVNNTCYFYLQRQGSIMNEKFNLNRVVRLEALEDRYLFLKDTIYKDLMVERILTDCLYFYKNVKEIYPERQEVLSNIDNIFNKYFKETKMSLKREYIHFILFKLFKKV